MKVTEQGLFFSGATAQTIAKKVVFRFCDMHRLLDPNFLPDVNHARPVVKLFFPKTIDKMNKESSNLDGPKPMLLADQDIELLFLVHFGEEEFKNQRGGQQSFFSKMQIEFGCNQVILVRDRSTR